MHATRAFHRRRVLVCIIDTCCAHGAKIISARESPSSSAAVDRLQQCVLYRYALESSGRCCADEMYKKKNNFFLFFILFLFFFSSRTRDNCAFQHRGRGKTRELLNLAQRRRTCSTRLLHGHPYVGEPHDAARAKGYLPFVRNSNKRCALEHVEFCRRFSVVAAMRVHASSASSNPKSLLIFTRTFFNKSATACLRNITVVHDSCR